MDDVELIGGVEHREIVTTDYDPEWVARFELERGRITSALGPIAVRIDHIGSTAVPGLLAKPVVDIQLSVLDVEDEEAYLPCLIAAGYLLRVRQVGHRMVRTPQLDVQVHVCATGSDWERRHLLFREWLRVDDVDRKAYGDLKQDLARHDWTDMNTYAAAKSPIIAAITDHAEIWARTIDWDLPASGSGL